MTKQYSLDLAHTHLADVVREVGQGETVELLDDQRPVAIVISPAAYARLRSSRPVDISVDIQASGESRLGDAPSAERVHRRPRIWENLEAWRHEHEIASLNITPDVFPGPRDRSPGRDVNL